VSSGPVSDGASGGAGRDDDPVVPDRADDDTDAGWGDRDDSPDPDDDDRFLRERPPHW
jgi:hypothetical protein